MMQQFCTRCGARVTVGDRFCMVCGAPLTAIPPSGPTAPVGQVPAVPTVLPAGEVAPQYAYVRPDGGAVSAVPEVSGPATETADVPLPTSETVPEVPAADGIPPEDQPTETAAAATDAPQAPGSPNAAFSYEAYRRRVPPAPSPQQPYGATPNRPYGATPYGPPSCAVCGAPLPAQGDHCFRCGAPFEAVGTHSAVTAGLLGIFLGCLGIHNFYLGRTGRALAQLLITVLAGWLILPLVATWIWGITEGILALVSPSVTDGAGRKLQR